MLDLRSKNIPPVWPFQCFLGYFVLSICSQNTLDPPSFYSVREGVKAIKIMLSIVTTSLNSFMSSWSLNAFVLICSEFSPESEKEVTAGGRDEDDKKSSSWPVPSHPTSVSSHWQYDRSHIPPWTRAGRSITRRGDLMTWESQGCSHLTGLDCTVPSVQIWDLRSRLLSPAGWPSMCVAAASFSRNYTWF